MAVAEWHMRIRSPEAQVILEMPNVKAKAVGMFDPVLLDGATVCVGGVTKYADCKAYPPVISPRAKK